MVRWTMLVATLAWAAAEISAVRRDHGQARAFYTAGLAFALMPSRWRFISRTGGAMVPR